MANRNLFPIAGSNHPDIVAVSGLLTFADDVGAAAAGSECTVSKSNGFISSVARTAEGIFPITFADSYAYCVGFCHGELTGNIRCQMTAQSIADTTPTVDITFETGSTGADVDPDGLAVYVTFFFKNSKYANGA